MFRSRQLILFLFDTLCMAAICAMLVFIAPSASSNLRSIGAKLSNCALLYLCVFVSRLGVLCYKRVWRYAGAPEYLRLVAADFMGGCIYLLLTRLLIKGFFALALSVSIVTVDLLAALSARFMYRETLNYQTRKARENNGRKINVAIIGAGRLGVQLAESMLQNRRSRYAPYCFFDVDPAKIANYVNGVKVYASGDEELDNMAGMPIQEVIIALSDMDSEKKLSLFNHYTKAGYPVKIYDYPVDRIGENKRRIREMRIEDLLSRDVCLVDTHKAASYYRGKTVLITGAGGSIGSELCRMLAAMGPNKLVMLDCNENNLYDVHQDLLRGYGDQLQAAVEIASVRDRERIRRIFRRYRPDAVIHAAAHKHVPYMEKDCAEAIKNNVMGTLNVADAAEEYGVDKFLLISSDKAVNPLGVMGASKRLCEMIVKSRCDSATRFAAVRFGNVLGSSGSVVPLFKRQIEAGGPVTITDKRMIRYFMTIPEAVSLVLEAGAMASQSEIYVLDMGKPVYILDLAEKMIRLAGYTPNEDIEIREIGLRPGEKLYEELLMKTDALTATPNARIFIERDIPLERGEVAAYVQTLLGLAEQGDDLCIRTSLLEMIPACYAKAEANARRFEAAPYSIQA